jgi:hypothetical protein
MAEEGYIKTFKRDSASSRFFSHIGLTDYVKAVSAGRKR